MSKVYVQSLKFKKWYFWGIRIGIYTSLNQPTNEGQKVKKSKSGTFWGVRININ